MPKKTSPSGLMHVLARRAHKQRQKEYNLLFNAAPDEQWIGSTVHTKREVSYASRQYIFTRDKHRCVACGWSPPEGQQHKRARKLTIDHILERCLGGTNALSNLQTMCSKCNGRKSAQLSHVMNLLMDGLCIPQGEAQQFLRKYYDTDEMMWNIGA